MKKTERTQKKRKARGSLVEKKVKKKTRTQKKNKGFFWICEKKKESTKKNTLYFLRFFPLPLTQDTKEWRNLWSGLSHRLKKGRPFLDGLPYRSKDVVNNKQKQLPLSLFQTCSFKTCKKNRGQFRLKKKELKRGWKTLPRRLKLSSYDLKWIKESSVMPKHSRNEKKSKPLDSKRMWKEQTNPFPKNKMSCFRFSVFFCFFLRPFPLKFSFLIPFFLFQKRNCCEFESHAADKNRKRVNSLMKTNAWIWK